MDARLVAFQRLIDILDELREKCPWDKKQTFESLRYLTIEETYELSDAIIDKNNKEIEGELGDLFLHLVFYSKLGAEEGVFDLKTVLERICEKLIYRHPHIYGDVNAQTESEVKSNWEKLKLKEGRSSVLQGVPKSLPAIVKAMRIQEKAKGVGFDWENKHQVWEKVQEELQELQQEVASEELNKQNKIEEEFGDVLFSLINYARFLNINPENALEKTNKKFIQRFQLMEQMVQKNKQNIGEININELNKLWEKAKKQLI